MPDVWLISGIPGAGKTTTARLLASRFERSVHIEGDSLQQMIVSGGVWPGDVPPDESPADEATSQLLLNIRNQCLLAHSYSAAGFTVFIDYVIVVRWTFEAFLYSLAGLSVRFVVLDAGKAIARQRDEPRPKSRDHKLETGRTLAETWAHLNDLLHNDLRGFGLCIDNSRLTPDEAVHLILARQEESFLPRPV